jgi:hypothetical protein
VPHRDHVPLAAGGRLMTAPSQVAARRARTGPVRAGARVPTALAAALGLLALAAAAPAADADDDLPEHAGAVEAERPAIWAGDAEAYGIGLQFHFEPAVLPVDDFVRLEVPQGSSSWDSTGLGEARAALVEPGLLFTQGPELLCSEFDMPCPDGFPPEYPLAASASSFEPEQTTVDGQARARVGDDAVDTVAGASLTGLTELSLPEALVALSGPLGDLGEAVAPAGRAVGDFADLLTPIAGSVTAPLAEIVEVDRLEASTRHWFDDQGVLNVHAVSRLSGVSLLDGLVTIDALETVSTSRAGTDDEDSAADVRITNLVVDGEPASGGEVMPLEALDDLDALTEVLEEALAPFSGEVAWFEAADGGPRGDATALRLDLRIPVDGPDLPLPLPDDIPFGPETLFRDWVVSINLGHAATTARADDFELGDLGDLDGPGVGGEGGSAHVGEVEESSAPTSEDDLETLAQVHDAREPPVSEGTRDVPAPAVSSTDSATGAPQAVTAAGELLGERTPGLLASAYLLVMVGTAALFAASRLGRPYGLGPSDRKGGLA